MDDHNDLGRPTEPAREVTSEVPEPGRTQAEHTQPTALEQPQCRSPSLSLPKSPTNTEEPESIVPRRPSIENLTHKLSRQDLRLDGSFVVPPRPSPPSPPLLPDVPPQQPCQARLDSSRGHQLDGSSLFDGGELDSFTLPFASLPSMMETDERAVPGTQTVRRQLSSRFSTDRINSRVAQNLLESMISTGSQCNVRSGPLPTSVASGSRNESAIETDPNINMTPVGLEVDEAYCEGDELAEDDLAWIENVISLRRAANPGGIRKQGLIRYRPSAEAGLRCANVVRNRPRMRRRPKLGPNSRTSSAVSSAISSPVIPPSLPDEHFH